MNRSVRIIDFYQDLYGMEATSVCDDDQHCEAALDLQSGIVYTALADYPDGDILAVALPGGRTHEVKASKVTEYLLQRHARAQALLDGGEANLAYQDVCEQMGRQVG